MVRMLLQVSHMCKTIRIYANFVLGVDLHFFTWRNFKTEKSTRTNWRTTAR